MKQSFGLLSLVKVAPLPYLWVIIWQESMAEGHDIQERTFTKWSGYDVTDVEYSLSYQSTSSVIQCSSLCLSIKNCNAFRFKNQICYNYVNAKTASWVTASDIYVFSNVQLIPGNTVTTLPAHTSSDPTTSKLSTAKKASPVPDPIPTKPTLIDQSVELIIKLGYKQYKNQQKFIKVYCDDTLWEEALKECQEIKGGTLFIIKNYDEASWLAETVNNKNCKDSKFWIGLKSNCRQKNLEWTDYSTISIKELNGYSAVKYVDRDYDDCTTVAYAQADDDEEMIIKFKEYDDIADGFVCQVNL